MLNQPIPFVSVIVITYNQSAFIKQAIESVLSQEIDFVTELIIGNDNSTDNSLSIIEEIVKKYSGKIIIRPFHHNKNIGMMNNLIFCLRQCKGNYIAICEGDDYWTDSLKLEKQVRLLEMNPVYSMAISNRSVVKRDGEFYDEFYEQEYRKTEFSISDIIEGFVPGTQTMLLRNFSNLPEYLAAHPEYYFGDRYIAYFCSLFGKICLLEEKTAVYRMTGNGVWSANNDLEKLHSMTKFMEDFHRSLGMPINNNVLAERKLSAAYITLRYCMKRPKLLGNKMYKQFIKDGWTKFNKMNRLKILFRIIFKG